MSKRKRQRRTAEAASSLPVAIANHTVAPGQQYDAPTSVDWNNKGSTNAPVIGEPEPAEGFAETPAGLAHRFLVGRVPLQYALVAVALPIACLATILWMLIQDNGSGLLKDWVGVKWWLVKSGIVVVVTTVAAVGVLIASKLLAPKSDA